MILFTAAKKRREKRDNDDDESGCACGNVLGYKHLYFIDKAATVEHGAPLNI